MHLGAAKAAPVLAHLMFRSADGSLTAAGGWMVGIGVLMVAGSFANLAGRGPGRLLAELTPRALRLGLGVLGVLLGVVFISWPFVASPGVLY